MKKRLTMILACLFLSLGLAMAQTAVTGTVVSQDDGQPIIGASVRLVGGNAGTVTDANGRFSISVPSGSHLRISYVGMQAKQVKAGQNLTITLESEHSDIDEVVVVGYGSARKISSLTGSVAVVNSDKIKNAPSASALDALQGQVAGLTVLTSSGVAGDNATSISLHGIGSLGASSTPLYVIDGIPSTSRTIMAMNPNDIKSVSVLKDASATSIYGSRAANGVIYITTKNGSYNSQAKVTFRTQVGWNTLANKGFYEDMMSGDELYDFWLNSGVTELNTGQDAAAYLESAYGKKGELNNTKWYDIMQNFNTLQTQNDISIEGGSDRVSYMIGASQFHQDGMAVGNYYDRYTLRTNIDAKPLTWLRTGVNINFSYDKNQTNANWGSSSGNANYMSGGLSYLLNPLWESIDPETGKLYAQRFPDGLMNPDYYMKNNPNVYSRYGMIGNAYVEISPIKGLKITSRLGADMYFKLRNYKSYPSYATNNGSGGKLRSSAFEYSYTMTNTIEYGFDINDDNHLTVLAGQEGIKNSYDFFGASSQGQVVDGLLNLGDGKQTTYSVSESATASKFLSFFGRVDYSLMDKYYLDASIRNDGCSRFGANNRNATFWSVGAMWKIKKESFMDDLTWINDLNIKASYGTQGNAGIGDYTAMRLLGTTTAYDGNTSIVLGQPYNGNLTWEKQGLFTVGFNGRVLDRIDFDIQYYHRKTTDMLMAVPYPYTSGFSSVYNNVGGLVNQGVDIRLGVDILKGKDYFLKFNTTFNYNSQKVTELFDGRNRWEIANTLVAYVVDSPVMYYMPIYAGVDKETGAPMWYKAGSDVDKKTTAETTTDYSEAALTQNTGKKRYAPINGGFGISAYWKGISLVADFSYVLGKYLVNNDAYFYDNPNTTFGYNSKKDVNNYWTESNPNAKYPDWSQGYVMQFDTHLLENASFLRLKNLQIGYEFPQSLIGFQNVVKGLKVTFTGRNLLTATSYGGMDPEVDSNLTYGVAGNTKQYLFGLEITF